LCGSFLIKHDYPYENRDLVNSYNSKFDISFSSYISLDQENGFSINAENKSYLFSIVPNEYQPANHFESINLMIFLLFSVAFLIFSFIQLAIRSRNKWAWLLPIILIGVRLLSIQFVWFGFMHDTEGFQASLYGTNRF